MLNASGLGLVKGFLCVLLTEGQLVCVFCVFGVQYFLLFVLPFQYQCK